MGIEAAHNNHIIHRDIKPQNIIISKEGKVKVTDFGIAKAASSNTITSNVMGSVHYTSPEQARGGFSDEKSDIYSMGITMFEMLTGRVPFNGDTTVAIAIKHIQDPMPLLRDFVPEVPQSVENIVMKCTQKSPDRRYQNMSEMIADLKRSLINPDAVIAQVDTEDDIGKTKIMPNSERTASISVPPVLNTVWEEKVPRRETYADDADLEAMPELIMPANTKRKNNSYEEDTYSESYYTDEEYYEDVEEVVKEKPVRNTKQKTQKGTNPSNTKKTVKKTQNKSSKKSGKKAGNKSEKNNKQNTKTKQNKASVSTSKTYNYYDEDYVQETVNRQNVRESTYDYEEDFAKNYGKNEYDYNPKAEGFTTILTVIAAVIIGCILLYFVGQATGMFEQIGGTPLHNKVNGSEIENVVMPEFADRDVEEVKEALNSVGLGYKTTFIESTQYTKNKVISAALEDGQTVLANDSIPVNTTIVLTASAGTNGINVPSVQGLSEAEGTATLTKEGFKVTKTQEASAEYAKGTIIAQFPEANTTAPLESEITIVISNGSDEVEVRMPGVLGNAKETAVHTLESAGLVVNSIEESYSEYPEGQICYQSYEAGTTVTAGTTIDLKISIGKETATYNCSLLIQAPEDYIGGNAEVLLTTADGAQQLWSAQNVTAFPVSINLNNFTSPSAYGIVIVTYVRNEEEPVIDADGNQTVQVVPKAVQTRQNVQFTKN